MDRQIFLNYLKESDISMNDETLDRFDTFYELLVEWNKFMNLTAITDYEEVVLKHFIDSIILLKYFDFKKVKNMIDVGTGAGFPGIPLKFSLPELNVTLLDSLNKRIKFLDEVIDRTGMSGINTIHSRAEDGARDKNLRENYDLAVSRAVANLSSLLEYCLPYVKVGGYFIAYKAGNSMEEIQDSKNALKILGGEISEIKEIVLPKSDISRTFVIIKKNKNTPVKYPRKAGLPTKEPLK